MSLEDEIKATNEKLAKAREARAKSGRPDWQLFGPDDDWHVEPGLVDAMGKPDPQEPPETNSGSS